MCAFAAPAQGAVQHGRGKVVGSGASALSGALGWIGLAADAVVT